MKQAWVWWVAGRFVRTRRREKKNVISILSIVGLALGVATLISVMAVMNGFQSGTIATLLDLQSFHLRIEGPAAQVLAGQGQALGELPTTQAGLRSVSVCSEVMGMVRGSHADPQPLEIRGIDTAELEWMLSHVDQTRLRSGSASLAADDTIVLGNRLAWRLGVQVGETLDIVTADADGLREFQLVVGAIVSFDHSLFDTGWAFVKREGIMAPVLEPGTFVALRIKDIDNDQAVARQLEPWLERHVGKAEYRLRSWREYNRSVFGVLRMEKLVMTLVIGLIFVVVGMNIFHDLRVSVLEKQEELGVLRALGASAGQLQSLFVLQGLIVGSIGAVAGFVLGLLLVQNLGAIYSAIVYLVAGIGLAPAWAFFPEMPVALRVDESLLIAAMAGVAAMVAAWLASRSVSRRDAAGILRYE